MHPSSKLLPASTSSWSTIATGRDLDLLLQDFRLPTDSSESSESELVFEPELTLRLGIRAGGQSGSSREPSSSSSPGSLPNFFDNFLHRI